MLNWLKWVVAPKEMSELERWRTQWEEHNRWFAEFKDASLVLTHMKDEVDGLPVTSINKVRDIMREARRDIYLKMKAEFEKEETK